MDENVHILTPSDMVGPGVGSRTTNWWGAYRANHLPDIQSVAVETITARLISIDRSVYTANDLGGPDLIRGQTSRDVCH